MANNLAETDRQAVAKAIDEIDSVFSNNRDIRRCPFRAFEALRDYEGLYYHDGIEAYVAARHEDITAIAANSELFSSRLPFGKVQARRDREVLEPILAEDASIQSLIDALKPRRTPVLVNSDPPEHMRQRRLVHSWFSGTKIKESHRMIKTIAEELIDGFRGGGIVDIVDSFAVPFPVHVIATLLGANVNERAQFKRWSDDFMRAAGNNNLSKEVLIASMKGNVELYEFLRKQMIERRARPQDDLITSIMNAKSTGDKPLNENELLGMFSQFLVAGNETTTALIGNALLVLARRPDLQEQLRREPDLVPAFVEETLRLESPVQGSFRMATADTTVSGVEIKKGEQVFLLYAAGNRDASVFEQDDYDLGGHKPSHLAFGFGEHFCLGFMLARTEARIAVSEMLRRFSEISLGSESPLEYAETFMVRSLASLPLQLVPADTTA